MNERQSQLLKTLVREYVDCAQPVSSSFLANRFSVSCSPATIRNELARLTDQGYVRKMYYSSGSVPTNKAYRFFVDEFLASENSEECETQHSAFESYEQAMAFLAHRTFALSALIDEDMNIAFDGVQELFSQPDFSTRDEYCQLARLVDDIVNIRNELFSELHDTPMRIRVAERGTLTCASDAFSSMTGSVRAGNNRDAVFFVIGPVRMPYERNWKTFQLVKRCLSRSEFSLN